MDGIPMDEYIKDTTGPIPDDDSIYIMSQILDAIQAAHDKGVVHRDIKPSNILINRQKEIKILDFGIAKKIDNTNQNHTRMGQKLGTLPYMSPEQIKGLPSISYETDIYSLGVLFYQMLCGKAPYGTDLTEYDISKNIVEYPLPKLIDIYKYVNPSFQRIVDKATEKEVHNRYKDCNAFKKDVIFVKNSGKVPKKKIDNKTKSPVLDSQNVEQKDSTKSIKKKYRIGLIVGVTIVIGILLGAIYYKSKQIVYGSVVDYDGNVYKTIKIGNQTWMAENLRVTHYADGYPIPHIRNKNEWSNLNDDNYSKAYCFYNNNEDSRYGALYTYSAATNGEHSGGQIQGVSPNGWHLPSENEWLELKNHFKSEAGSQLAGEKSTWKVSALVLSSYFGKSGFDAPAAGSCSGKTGKFYNMGLLSNFWCSTERNKSEAIRWFITYKARYIHSYKNNKANGFSVRCIKNR